MKIVTISTAVLVTFGSCLTTKVLAFSQRSNLLRSSGVEPAFIRFGQDSSSGGFTTEGQSSSLANVKPLSVLQTVQRVSKFNSGTNLMASSKTDNTEEISTEGGFLDGIELNPKYAIALIVFLTYAIIRSTGEEAGASQLVLEKFFADPVNPGVNELFVSVFNLLGIVPVPLACLIMPGAKGQKLPAAPFVGAGAFFGYSSTGVLLSTWKPVTEVTKSELGWVTKNLLENKVFNWFIVALVTSIFFQTGFVSSFLSDPSGQIMGYKDLFSSTAICSVSSLDLVILSLSAASLIPEDLKRRGMEDSAKAYAIAASTLLLPVVGSTIYCALRPELPEE